MVKLKLYPADDGEIMMLGKIPLHNLFHYLANYKEYNKELVIDYIKEIYETDLHKELNEYRWWLSKENIFDSFTKKYPRTGYETNNRQYFENKGRNYYFKFLKYCGYELDIDLVYAAMRADEVHHIFPLVYGGDNSLENLIHISKWHHDLLHENPKEEDKKSCFKAVDYLWYLHYQYDSEKNAYLVHKYNLLSAREKSNTFLIDSYKAAIREEMYEFYSSLD